MHKVVSLNPFRCRMWEYHDRLDDNVSEETCRAEIESFQKHGQLVPVLGRLLQHDSNHEVELVFGARRLFVARHLNKPLLVDLRQLSDLEAIVAMDIENRQRLDISPYERGLSYTRWLRSGHFTSQEELARALQISSSQVSRLLKLARIPTAILKAFNGGIHICEGWGLDLLDALDDPQKRQRTLQHARTVADMTSRPPAKEVYRQLLAASVVGHKPRATRRDNVVKGTTGEPLLRIRHQTKSIALLLPIERVSTQALTQICAAIVGIVESTALQSSGPTIGRLMPSARELMTKTPANGPRRSDMADIQIRSSASLEDGLRSEG